MPSHRIINSTYSSCKSSENMKGSLVFIQSAASSTLSPSPLIQSLPSRRNLHTILDSTAASQSTNSKRLPVVVNVHSERCKHFAIINFVGRYQLSHSPMYVNLKKYNVQQHLESNTIVLNHNAQEGMTLTFEATNSVKASEWVEAFSGHGHYRKRAISNQFGNHYDLHNSTTNLLEEISEEMCTDENIIMEDSESTHNFINNIRTTQDSFTTTSLIREKSSNNSSRKFSSAHHGQIVSPSRRSPLPVLSELSELDEEEMYVDSEQGSFCDDRLD